VFCINCGAQLPDNAKFCSSCGSIISALEEVNNPKESQIQPDVQESLEKPAPTKKNDEENTGNIALIGLALMCLYIIFKPGFLGISMYDMSSVDSGASSQVALLFIASLILFLVALRKPKSEEEIDSKAEVMASIRGGAKLREEEAREVAELRREMSRKRKAEKEARRFDPDWVENHLSVLIKIRYALIFIFCLLLIIGTYNLLLKPNYATIDVTYQVNSISPIEEHSSEVSGLGLLLDLRANCYNSVEPISEYDPEAPSAIVLARLDVKNQCDSFNEQLYRGTFGLIASLSLTILVISMTGRKISETSELMGSLGEPQVT